MINFTTNVRADHYLIFLKKETLDHLNAYLASRGEMVTTTTYDDIIQEWVNWQKKAAQEEKTA